MCVQHIQKNLLSITQFITITEHFADQRCVFKSRTQSSSGDFSMKSFSSRFALNEVYDMRTPK